MAPVGRPAAQVFQSHRVLRETKLEADMAANFSLENGSSQPAHTFLVKAEITAYKG